jgi:hypothetical protein
VLQVAAEVEREIARGVCDACGCFPELSFVRVRFDLSTECAKLSLEQRSNEFR